MRKDVKNQSYRSPELQEFVENYFCLIKKRRQTPITHNANDEKYYVLNVFYVILAPKDLYFLLSKSVWTESFIYAWHECVDCCLRQAAFTLTYIQIECYGYLLLWYIYICESEISTSTSLGVRQQVVVYCHCRCDCVSFENSAHNKL